MVWWVNRSIPQGGHTELFFVPANASRLVLKKDCYVLYCLWDGEYKISERKKEC